MNNLKKWFFTAVVVCLNTGVVQAQSPILQRHELTTGYIPTGFDDNDNAQVTAEGWFTDTCYKFGTMQSKVSGGVVKLETFVYRYLATFCLEIMVPFHQTVNLGILPKGTYTVVDSQSERNLGSLSIAAANTANPDDYLYAPVADANVQVNSDKLLVSFNGTFGNSCLTLQEVKSRIAKNVIEMLPIAKVSASNKCLIGSFPFSQTVTLSRPSNGRYLLHMRTLNGNSINKVIEVY